MDKDAADLLQRGDELQLTLGPGAVLRTGGDVEVVVLGVEGDHLKVGIRETVFVPLKYIRSYKRSSAPVHSGGIEDIVPSRGYFSELNDL